MQYYPGKVLLVGTPNNFPQGTDAVKTTYYMDGREALKIVAVGTGKSY